MRIRKLTFQAFGPFVKKTEIDFEPFRKEGLFLICGDTGSGKTTIFDAITFALYGQSSGEIRENTMLRSDFAKDGEKTFVELVFEYKGVTYSVYRAPSYVRKKKRGEGTVEQAAQVLLTLPNGKTLSKITDVNEKIVDIIGLSREQFRQTAMIAQGDFLKLLLASSQERSDIFRKIFSTDFYRDLERNMKNLRNKTREEMERLDFRVLEKLKNAHVDERIEFDSVLLLEEKVAPIDTWNEEKTLFIKGQKEKLSHLEKELEILIHKETIALEYYKDLKEKASLEVELKQWNENLPGIEEKEIQVERGKIASQVEGYYLSFIDALKEEVDLVNSLEELVQRQEALLREKEELSQEEEKIKILREEVVIKDKEYIQLVPQLKQFREKEKQANSLRVQKENLEEMKENIEERTEKVGKLEEGVNALYLEISKIPELEGKRREINLLIEDEKKRLERQNKRNLYLVELENWSEKEERTEEKVKLCLEELKELESLCHQEWAYHLAQELEDNQPCPVCGSTHHPSPANMINGMEWDNIKEKREEIASLEEELQKIREKRSTVKGHLSILVEEKQKDKSLEEMLLESENLEKQLKELAEKSEDYQRLQEKLKEDQKALRELTVSLQKNGESYNVLLGSLKSLEEILPQMTLEEAESALLTLEKYLENSREQISAFETRKDNHSHSYIECLSLLKEKKLQLGKSKEKSKTQKEVFESELNNKGIPSQGDFEKWRRDPVAIEESQKEIQEFRKKQDELLKSIDEKKKRLAKERPQEPEILREQLEEKRNLQKEIQYEIAEVSMKIQQNTQILEKVKEFLKKREIISEKNARIDELTRLISGDLSGKQKIKLESYVQQQYFDDIIQRANQRFLDMSQGRYELVRKSQRGSGLRQGGLDLDVFDYYTGKHRDVKTLSGGESFKASLSLALGLSDMVEEFSGGIQMETLLIDEGFGTLDGDSLAVALQVLIEISQGKTMVGIISHVGELKDQIQAQIQVHKSNVGSTITLLHH